MQMSQKKALEILGTLEGEFPDARTLLRFENPFQLLVATILAAQCTDERVNQVTESLFRQLPNPKTMMVVAAEELEQMIVDDLPSEWRLACQMIVRDEDVLVEF